MKLRTLIKQFEEAVRQDEMAGSEHPLTAECRRQQYQNFKKFLLANIPADAKVTVIPKFPPIEWPTDEDIDAYQEAEDYAMDELRAAKKKK